MERPQQKSHSREAPSLTTSSRRFIRTSRNQQITNVMNMKGYGPFHKGDGQDGTTNDEACSETGYAARQSRRTSQCRRSNYPLRGIRGSFTAGKYGRYGASVGCEGWGAAK